MALVTPEEFFPTATKGFVVVEGVNGAGKSTLLRSLEEYLSTQGVKAISSFEPGATPLGRKLREILLGVTPPISRSPLAEAMLFSADRAEHVRSVIVPALQSDTFVLLDRYYYSTLAFQGYGRGLSLDMLHQLNALAIDGVAPDLVILLDLDPEEGLRRNSRKVEEDSFESEELAFHRRLREGFLTLAKELPEPFLVIDARETREKVAGQARAALEKIIASRESFCP